MYPKKRGEREGREGGGRRKRREGREGNGRERKEEEGTDKEVTRSLILHICVRQCRSSWLVRPCSLWC